MPLLANIAIGELKFVLLFRKDKKQKGKYKIFDFFRTEMNVAYKDEAGQMVPISQFFILTAQNLLKINNLRIEALLSSYQKVDSKDKYIRANWFLLDLLLAYDNSEEQRKDLLQVAEEFAVWIKDFDNDSLEYPIKMLNYYQIIKRKRSFNIEEISELWNIADNSST